MFDELALPSTVGEGQEPDGVRALKRFGYGARQIEFNRLFDAEEKRLRERAETPVRHETKERSTK